jgi:hypothetical protein
MDRVTYYSDTFIPVLWFSVALLADIAVTQYAAAVPYFSVAAFTLTIPAGWCIAFTTLLRDSTAAACGLGY